MNEKVNVNITLSSIILKVILCNLPYCLFCPSLYTALPVGSFTHDPKQEFAHPDETKKEARHVIARLYKECLGADQVW